MRTRLSHLLLVSALWCASAKLNSDEGEDSGDQTLDSGDGNNTIVPDDNDPLDHVAGESGEKHMGASVARVRQHPYAAALLHNGTYVCSLAVLNTHWLITQSKCFDQDTIASYVTHSGLDVYSVRVGSSYSNKGGSIHKLQMLINNFDMKVSAVKLQQPLIFSSRVSAVRLPSPDEEVTLGYLASMVAWTPAGHMRQVNAPVVEASICEAYTQLMGGHYICVGGVQDPNRNFCRRDNGGAVVQNNTLIAISSFLHTCALYTRTHAFPKISSFARWLESIIWDENKRPSSTQPPNPSEPTTDTSFNTTSTTNSPLVGARANYYEDPRKFMLKLPFDPIKVPLEPAADNSVLPGLSLYESYLQNIARAKTSTTEDPEELEERARRDWMEKFGKIIPLPPGFLAKNQFDYS